MKTVVVAALLLSLAACGTGGDSRARDPGGARSSAPRPGAMPVSIPAAAGPVATRQPATVMDTGHPELCLGAVAESYPPQCHGLPLRGWDWADRHGVYEQSGAVRWGLFVVSGAFDGTTLTVRGAIPAALYDPARPTPTGGSCEELPVADCAGPSPARLAQVQRELEALPGLLDAHASRFRVEADVVFDDGSLQAWADATYGAGVVLISSALVPTAP